MSKGRFAYLGVVCPFIIIPAMLSISRFCDFREFRLNMLCGGVACALIFWSLKSPIYKSWPFIDDYGDLAMIEKYRHIIEVDLSKWDPIVYTVILLIFLLGLSRIIY